MPATAGFCRFNPGGGSIEVKFSRRRGKYICAQNKTGGYQTRAAENCFVLFTVFTGARRRLIVFRREFPASF
jgi:hypothetical protein